MFQKLNCCKLINMRYNTGMRSVRKKLDYGLQKIQVNNNDVDTFILCSMKRYTYRVKYN